MAITSSDFSKKESGYTIVELLVSASAILIVSFVLAIMINPIEFVRFQRDRRRINDLRQLNDIINIIERSSPSAIQAKKNLVYISLPDQSEDCAGWRQKGLSSLAGGYSYHCAPPTDLRKINGEGWVPIDFTNLTSADVPFKELPVDPLNGRNGTDPESGRKIVYFYQYIFGSHAVGSSFQTRQMISNLTEEVGQKTTVIVYAAVDKKELPKETATFITPSTFFIGNTKGIGEIINAQPPEIKAKVIEQTQAVVQAVVNAIVPAPLPESSLEIVEATKEIITRVEKAFEEQFVADITLPPPPLSSKPPLEEKKEEQFEFVPVPVVVEEGKPPQVIEPSNEICGNNFDDDSDGLVDALDPNCVDFSSLNRPEVCDDFVDNDNDGFIDCTDSDCSLTNYYCLAAAGFEVSCADEKDNDRDGDVDCQDGDCDPRGPFCAGESSSCNDRFDNDGDGETDCEDRDCFDNPTCGSRPVIPGPSILPEPGTAEPSSGANSNNLKELYLGLIKWLVKGLK